MIGVPPGTPEKELMSAIRLVWCENAGLKCAECHDVLAHHDQLVVGEGPPDELGSNTGFACTRRGCRCPKFRLERGAAFVVPPDVAARLHRAGVVRAAREG